MYVVLLWGNNFFLIWESNLFLVPIGYSGCFILSHFQLISVRFRELFMTLPPNAFDHPTASFRLSSRTWLCLPSGAGAMAPHGCPGACGFWRGSQPWGKPGAGGQSSWPSAPCLRTCPGCLLPLGHGWTPRSCRGNKGQLFKSLFLSQCPQFMLLTSCEIEILQGCFVHTSAHCCV